MKNILFVCTHNRCRSILGQAITNHINDDRVYAQSAGALPANEVHPLTIKHLNQRNIATEGLTSKSWNDLQEYQPDIVITVCDQAAKETCPVWLGDSINIHWGLPDPSNVNSDQQSSVAFANVIETFEIRMRFVLCHDIEKMSDSQLETLFLRAAENR